MAFVNSLVCPSPGGKRQALFPSSHWATRPTLQSPYAQFLCGGTALARQGDPAKAFPLDLEAWAPLPRSSDQPFQNLLIPGLPWLFLPPSVPQNPRALTWASLILGWSGRLPEGPEAPVFPSPESTLLWETAFSPPATNPGARLHGSTHAAPGGARWPGLQPLERICLWHRPQSCLGGRGGEVGEQSSPRVWRTTNCGSQTSARSWAVSSRP